MAADSNEYSDNESSYVSLDSGEDYVPTECDIDTVVADPGQPENIFQAIERCTLEKLDQLLIEGMSLEERNEKNQSVLENIDALIAHSEIFHKNNFCNETYKRIKAVIEYHIAVKQYEVDSQQAWHRDYSPEQRLLDAASAGCVHSVRALLTKGANYRVRNKYGCMPIHQAAWYSHPKVVIELLSHDPTQLNETTTGGYNLMTQVVYGEGGHERLDLIAILLLFNIEKTYFFENNARPGAIACHLSHEAKLGYGDHQLFSFFNGECKKHITENCEAILSTLRAGECYEFNVPLFGKYFSSRRVITIHPSAAAVTSLLPNIPTGPDASHSNRVATTTTTSTSSTATLVASLGGSPETLSRPAQTTTTADVDQEQIQVDYASNFSARDQQNTEVAPNVVADDAADSDNGSLPYVDVDTEANNYADLEGGNELRSGYSSSS